MSQEALSPNPYAWAYKVGEIDERDDTTAEDEALYERIFPESEYDASIHVSVGLTFYIDEAVREKAAEHFGGEEGLSELESRLAQLDVDAQLDVVAELSPEKKAAAFEIGRRQWLHEHDLTAF